MSAIIAWLAGTKLGRWIVGIGVFLAALGAALLAAFEKGKGKQARADKAKQAQQQADAVQVAQQTYTDASQAAVKVEADAAKQPPPDPVKRDDLDTNF